MKTFFLKEKPLFNIPYKYYCVQYYTHKKFYLSIYQKILMGKSGIDIALTLFGIGFEFLWTRYSDHAGIQLDINLPFCALHHQIYDSRHWDYDKNTWRDYPKESKKKEKIK